MGKSWEDSDNDCPICKTRMHEVWGDISGQSCYYYDECEYCGIHIDFAFGVHSMMLRDLIRAVRCAMEPKSWKEKQDFQNLLEYFELFL